jgi:hypothetical protein
VLAEANIAQTIVVPSLLLTGVAARRYVYVPNLAQRVQKKQDNRLLFGLLNENGDFILYASYPKNSVSRMPKAKPINTWTGTRVKCYEFRSGRLILGETLEDGRFVPDIGSEVIDFQKDYKYSPSAIRIYNLPGSFVEVNPKTEKPK